MTGDVLLPEEFTVNDASCAGAGQASGIREGLAVVITNELESIGAMGALGPGVPAADGCRFPFVIDHVSRGLGRYKVDLDLDDTTGWVAGVALPEDDLFARPLTVSLVRSDRGS